MLAICYCELGRPEMAFGLINDLVTGKAEVMGLLAKSFAMQGSWTKVEEILAKDFEGKDGAVQLLAKEFCNWKRVDDIERLLRMRIGGVRRGSEDTTLRRSTSRLEVWDNMERTLRFSFLGRERIVKYLVMIYIQYGRLDDAEELLTYLVDGGEEDTLERLGFTHLLAEVKFRKGDLKEARDCCIQAFHGRVTILGRDHVLSHQSRYLLARIFKAQGDEEESKGHETLLPKEFKGMHSNPRG